MIEQIFWITRFRGTFHRKMTLYLQLSSSVLLGEIFSSSISTSLDWPPQPIWVLARVTGVGCGQSASRKLVNIRDCPPEWARGEIPSFSASLRKNDCRITNSENALSQPPSILHPFSSKAGISFKVSEGPNNKKRTIWTILKWRPQLFNVLGRLTFFICIIGNFFGTSFLLKISCN